MKALGFRSSTILIIPSPKLLIGFVICSALSVLRILNSTWVILGIRTWRSSFLKHNLML